MTGGERCPRGPRVPGSLSRCSRQPRSPPPARSPSRCSRPAGRPGRWCSCASPARRCCWRCRPHVPSSGRWHLLWRSWRQVVAYGTVPRWRCPSWPSSTRSSTSRWASRCCWSTSGWCSSVAWQCVAARRLPRTPTVVGIVLAVLGLLLVLDLLPVAGGGQVRVDGVGRALGPARGRRAGVVLPALRPLRRGLAPAARARRRRTDGGRRWASPLLGYVGLLPMTFRHRRRRPRRAPGALVGRGGGAGRVRRGHRLRDRDRRRPDARRQAGLVRRPLRGDVRRALRLAAAGGAAAAGAAPGRAVPPGRGGGGPLREPGPDLSRRGTSAGFDASRRRRRSARTTRSRTTGSVSWASMRSTLPSRRWTTSCQVRERGWPSRSSWSVGSVRSKRSIPRADPTLEHRALEVDHPRRGGRDQRPQGRRR